MSLKHTKIAETLARSDSRETVTARPLEGCAEDEVVVARTTNKCLAAWPRPKLNFTG